MVVLVARFVGVLARALAGAFARERLEVAFFGAEAFDALCARALPAGERLVAGFRRADLRTRLRPVADFADDRTEEREDNLFSGLLIMNELPIKRRLNKGAAYHSSRRNSM